jgi:hypothetical protein
LSAAPLFVDDRSMTNADRTDALTKLIEAGLDQEAARRGASERDPKGGTMDTLTQLGHLGPLLAGVVGGIRPDQLDEPTPCSQYTVRGVLEHMIGGATLFAAAYRGETPKDPDTTDVLAGFGPVLEELGGAITAPGALARTIATPFGDFDGDSFAR